MQVIGVVVADTEQHARMAAQRVKIEYEDLPSLISCEDAIKAKSYFEVHQITCHREFCWFLFMTRLGNEPCQCGAFAAGLPRMHDSCVESPDALCSAGFAHSNVALRMFCSPLVSSMLCACMY